MCIGIHGWSVVPPLGTDDGVIMHIEIADIVLQTLGELKIRPVWTSFAGAGMIAVASTPEHV